MAALQLPDLTDLLDQFGERDEDVSGELSAAGPGASLHDLGFDSLGIFNVTVQISNHYGTDIPYDDVTHAQTLGELLDVVNRALALTGA